MEDGPRDLGQAQNLTDPHDQVRPLDGGHHRGNPHGLRGAGAHPMGRWSSLIKTPGLEPGDRRFESYPPHSWRFVDGKNSNGRSFR